MSRIRKCEQCKLDIDATRGPQAKLCSSCSVKNRNESKNKYSKKNYKHLKEMKKENEVLKKNKSDKNQSIKINDKLPSKEDFFYEFRNCKFVHSHKIIIECVGEKMGFDWKYNEEFRKLFFAYKKEFDNVNISEHWEYWLETEGVRHLEETDETKQSYQDFFEVFSFCELLHCNKNFIMCAGEKLGFDWKFDKKFRQNCILAHKRFKESEEYRKIMEKKY